MSVTVSSNVRDVIKELRAGASEAKPAIVRALNRMAAQIKVRGAREIRQAGYKLKISDIKNAISIRRASTGSLSAAAVGSGRPIPLIKYATSKQSARGLREGVTVDVLNGRQVVAHAFIANTPNGGQQVFLRKPGAKHRKVIVGGKAKWSELPIKKLYGPGIPDALANKAVERAILDLVGERFPQILAHENEWLRKRLDRKPANPSDD